MIRAFKFLHVEFTSFSNVVVVSGFYVPPTIKVIPGRSRL